MAYTRIYPLLNDIEFDRIQFNKIDAALAGVDSPTGDIILNADSDGSGDGAIILQIHGVEKARVYNDGTGGGLFAATGNNLPTINQIGTLNAGGGVVTQPYVNWYRNKNGAGNVLMWQAGLDVANDTGNGLEDSWYLFRGYQDGTAGGQDVIFVTDYGNPALHTPKVAIGLGYTPPPSGYRVAISSPDNDSWGALRLRMGASSTGAYLSAFQSGGATMFQLNNDGSVRGVDNAVNALGFAVADVGSDASNVLTVTGRATGTGDTFHVGVSGSSGLFSVKRDTAGATEVLVNLKASGGTTNVQLRTATQIALFQAAQDSDAIVLIQATATASGIPLLIKKGSTTLFSVGAAGNVNLLDGGNLALGTVTGSKIGTAGGASGQKLAFFNATPVVQPLLATGAAHTVDDVITTLQTLGLVRQS